MDWYSTATSWTVFASLAAFGCWYYYPRQQRVSERHREDAQHAVASRKKRTEPEERGRPNKRPSSERLGDNASRSTAAQPGSTQAGKDSLRKRKAPTEEPIQATASVVVAASEPEEDDMSTRKWAEGMLQTQKGHEISSTKTKESRVKTVKQSSALHTPAISSESSQVGAEVDDDMSPGEGSVLDAGGVSDMLEPVSKGPTSLRLVAPTQPQRERGARQPKEEVVETKKQRQNRKKVEERRVQRESEERERKQLEENQRRAAREARGEPAKNGIPVAKPPTNTAWATSSVPGSVSVTNGNQNAPLLDTFDAESVSSSNGGLDASTGPTSTTSGGVAQWDQEALSEEEQMAQAMKQSEDESGWTTVSQPKKQKKKGEAPLPEPALSDKTNLKQTTNGKPKGFQALEVQYEQRTDADPNDASNWDA